MLICFVWTWQLIIETSGYLTMRKKNASRTMQRCGFFGWVTVPFYLGFHTVLAKEMKHTVPASFLNKNTFSVWGSWRNRAHRKAHNTAKNYSKFKIGLSLSFIVDLLYLFLLIFCIKYTYINSFNGTGRTVVHKCNQVKDSEDSRTYDYFISILKPWLVFKPSSWEPIQRKKLVVTVQIMFWP